MIMTLQQIINERISFLKEQINHENKPGVNLTFQLQIDAIRSVDDYDIEKVEYIIKEKKTLPKNSKDVHDSDRLFAELGLEWLQRKIERYTWGQETSDLCLAVTLVYAIRSYCSPKNK